MANLTKPILFSIDDDPSVSRAIVRDLKSKFGMSYRIMSSISAEEALDNLPVLKAQGGTVALFLCDQRMPGMDGVAFLAAATAIFPDAKKILLTAYSETDAAIRAINEIRLDQYLLKPWDPPEEKLYPVITDLLEDWRGGNVAELKGIKIIGYAYSPHSHLVKDYLASNLIPYQWLDIEHGGAARTFLTANALAEKDLPAIIYEDGSYQLSPTIQNIAGKTGKSPQLAHEVYDTVIVGAGPAGLAAAVYGASEGLKTLLVERKAPGGQAGTSSRIENYLGFPAGLSGADLTRRAVSQAKRLGAELISPCTVADIHQKDSYKTIVLEDGREIISRTVIVTTGVDYRRFDISKIDAFNGAGVYYGASTTEIAACRGRDVYILGGGNSAGQSAVYLSNFAKEVFIVIRKDSLAYTMSAYLIDQIKAINNIHLLTDSEIVEVDGRQHLECLTIVNSLSGTRRIAEAAALYIFIGAKPHTDWINPDVLRNEKGYILTGMELARNEELSSIWKLPREPFLLETSCEGIFAAGDVRAGAMARVASAVGEGSMAISFVHKYIGQR